ncbi:hypothetical protein NON20_00750 [Synechocystis sp. B12]|nr:hypothetical protein NON20_00750 [Synechocystis sp. B12]
MSHNYAEWIRTYAPVAVNDPNKPELVEEFSHCLLQLRPDIGLVVFSLIIMSDYRREVSSGGDPDLNRAAPGGHFCAAHSGGLSLQDYEK